MTKQLSDKNYVPNPSLVKRLLIKLDAEFFILSQNEQDKRRQHLLFNHSDKIYAFLYKELFEIGYDSNWDQHDDPLTSEQLHLLNAHTTLLCGIGENAFKLNELKDDSFDLTTFSTLYDKDKDEFYFQQGHWRKEIPDYEEKPYQLYLNHCWARLIDQNCHFHYITLSSLSFYILDELQETDDAVIQSLIPYQWEEGEEHGKPTKGGIQWDFKRNAKGREAELEELLDRVRHYQSSRYQALNEQFDLSNETFVYLERKQSSLDGSSINIIINNSKAAKRISFKHFLRDCEALERPFLESKTLLLNETKMQERFIKEAYQDICKNFDPTVLKFKKKNKLIFSQTALSDLDAIGEIEDDEGKPDE